MADSGSTNALRMALTPVDVSALAAGGRAGSLERRDPGLSERIGNALYDLLRAAGVNSLAHRMRGEGQEAINLLPVVGDAIGISDALRDYFAGNTGRAAAGIGLAAIGAIPGVGDAASRLARGAFELDYFGVPVRILQNPSPKQVQGFLNRTKYKAARRIHDPRSGETYIWDAADPALHQLMAEQLGLPVDDQLVMDIIGFD